MLDQGYPLLLLAIVLVAGVFSGQMARRFRLPTVTGQILAGILIGPSVLNIAGVDAIHGLHPVTHFALGLIAVAVGNHLNLKRLRNARNRLLWLLLLEVTITPALVFLAIYVLPDVSWSFAFLLATMAISTAPATVVALVKESNARGVYVKTLVAAVALNNIACIAFFEMAHTAARVSRGAVGGGGVDDVLMAPLIELELQQRWASAWAPCWWWPRVAWSARTSWPLPPWPRSCSLRAWPTIWASPPCWPVSSWVSPWPT